MKQFIRSSVATCILVLSLTACSTFGAKQAAYTCTSTAAIIDIATEANRAGKLKPEQKEQISEVIDKVAVVCESPTPPTAEELRSIGVGELVKILHEQGVL